MTSGGAEEAADRALTSVARKLNKALSVEYTVNELIAEATDLTNLATLYFGEWLCLLNLTFFFITLLFRMGRTLIITCRT